MMKALIVTLALCLSTAGYAQSGPGAAPEVKLLKAGKGKKRQLRYEPKAGSTKRMEMRMLMDMSLSMGGRQAPSMPMPTMTMSFTTKVIKRHANGDFDSVMTLVNAGAEKTRGVAPEVFEAVKRALVPLTGIKMTGRTSPRGFVKRMDVESPPSVPAAMQQTVDSMKQSAEQMAQPFPKESVGVGAEWVVTQYITQNGMRLKQVSKVVLLSMKGNVIKTKTSLVQSARPQNVQLPNLPPGMTTRLNALKGSGDATGKFNLSSVVPVTSKASVKTHVDMKMQMQGESMDMTMDVGMTLTIGR